VVGVVGIEPFGSAGEDGLEPCTDDVGDHTERDDHVGVGTKGESRSSATRRSIARGGRGSASRRSARRGDFGFLASLGGAGRLSTGGLAPAGMEPEPKSQVVKVMIAEDVEAAGDIAMDHRYVE
jgi:hypothetical protein